MAEPIASGSLLKTPLPHLLIYLDQKRLNGTLAIWPDQPQEGDNRQDRILMLKGRPVAGRFMEEAASLQEGLLPLFQRVEAPYAFYDGNLLGSTEGRINGRVDPLALVAESLRQTARQDVVEAVLGRYENMLLQLADDAELERFALQPDEQQLVDAMRDSPVGIAELAAGSSLPAQRVQRLIYLLAISKSVQAIPAEGAAAAPAAPAGPASPEAPAAAPSSRPPSGRAPAPARSSSRDLAEMPPPPESLSDELREKWLLMVTKGKLIENQNYFEMLGLEREATGSDVRSQFVKLAKEWHPDRLPQELNALRPYAEIIFGYMSEANSTLSNEDGRMKYLQTVREGGGTPATDKLMESILDSAMQYEKVLVLTRKHQYEDALNLLRRILSVTKDEPEYHAMHAWLLMKKFPGPDAPLTDVLESCDIALKLHDRHEKAHLYRAQVLKRMGRDKEALKHFKTVVEINPRNIDAAREVRVAKMRGTSTDHTKTDEGGLLGKFFKRKK